MIYDVGEKQPAAQHAVSPTLFQVLGALTAMVGISLVMGKEFGSPANDCVGSYPARPATKLPDRLSGSDRAEPSLPHSDGLNA